MRLDLAYFRQVAGIGRDILEGRIGTLANRVEQVEAYAATLLANLTRTQTRCTELLDETRALRRSLTPAFGTSVDVVVDMLVERWKGDCKHGTAVQLGLPDGTGAEWRDLADHARRVYDEAKRNGTLTWRHALAEEVAEAFAESEPASLRVELIQVAALACKWVDAIDARADHAQSEGDSRLLTEAGRP